jgi:hypothetical protein
MVGFHKQINLSWYEVGNPAMTHKAEALLGFRPLNLKGEKIAWMAYMIQLKIIK